MSSEPLPNDQALEAAFDHDIYSSSGSPLKFGSLFYDCDVYPAEKRVLVIFIRHFFCGNCQEYVRRLSSTESPFHPSHKSTSTATWTTNFSKPASRTLPNVVIIGPGQPSLISTYKSATECPFDIYADPSIQLYNILGMRRTLSMGSKSPGYIEHSLLSGAVKSAWQIVRRVGNGDAMAGGDWDVNGGEFLFARSAMRSRSSSRSPSRSRSRSTSARSQAMNSLDWETSWCHRMANSRDHTELVDLAYNTCFLMQSSPAHENNSRTNSPAPPLKSILVNSKIPTQALSHSYSSERLGSCPAPEIPKSRADVQVPLHHNRIRSSSQSKSKSPQRTRSRSTSVQSRNTAKQNHDRIWSSMSTTDASRSDSRASNTVSHEAPTINPISEAEEEEIKPRKSFSASVADALGIRAMLKRSKSVTGSYIPADGAPAVPRPSTSLSDLRTASRTNAEAIKPRSRSRSISGPMALLGSKSKTKSQAARQARSHSEARSSSPSKKPAYTRARTFSFSSSSPTSRHKPSLSLVRKSSGTVEMDENGVMFVDGVEFVNVLKVTARVDSEEERRRRERADSGLGMDVTHSVSAVGTRALKAPPPVPMPMLASRKADGLTALPVIMV